MHNFQTYCQFLLLLPFWKAGQPVGISSCSTVLQHPLPSDPQMFHNSHVDEITITFFMHLMKEHQLSLTVIFAVVSYVMHLMCMVFCRHWQLVLLLLLITQYLGLQKDH